MSGPAVERDLVTAGPGDVDGPGAVAGHALRDLGMCDLHQERAHPAEVEHALAVDLPSFALGSEEAFDWICFAREPPDLLEGEALEERLARAQQVLRDGVALLANEGTGESTQATESLISTRAHSVMCVPLIMIDRTLGVLYLDTTLPRDRFNRDHLQLVAAIAGIAAVAIENARHFEWLATENERLLADVNIEHNMVGESAAMQRVYHFISKVAPTEATVLISGESGTGKELAARAIHRNSKRAQKTFIAVNCAALTETLATNTVAQAGLIQAALPALRPGGAVVVVSSDAAHEPYRGWAAYGASKAALEQLANVLAAEREDLRVYRVDPGDMRTAMHAAAFPDEDISARPAPEASVPGLVRLLDGSLPSGRYAARSLAAAEGVAPAEAGAAEEARR